jgi:hypothetical protein
MAGDWLKFEVDLPEKPEVWQIAGLLQIDPDAVVGKLMKVWRWFDKHTESGNAANVTYPLLDSLVGVTGFAEAMVFAGWLEQRGCDLCLPNFDRHNGKTAKNRALTAKRVAKTRNAPIVTSPLAREEKRREEEKQKQAPATPVALPDWIPSEAWDGFVENRRKIRHPMTPRAAELIVAELTKLRAAGADPTQVLDQSTRNGWRDVFPVRGSPQAATPAPNVPGGGRVKFQGGKPA